MIELHCGHGVHCELDCAREVNWSDCPRGELLYAEKLLYTADFRAIAQEIKSSY